ncbi:isochorismate synthase [Virgibacillus doumboii]|uniref:isochorismate synthase n=1 Tax=Virgibacillus doumboii TaxID=2697503 RepID=UPI0013DEB172|nr:isochorismate synthase [Virgibacillus doumboii]
MIEIKEELLESLLDDAISQAKLTNKTKLISITKKIKKLEPLHFFESAKDLSMDRTFWTNTSETFYLVGAGSACHISAGDDRFQETERQWKKLHEAAIIHNPYKFPGTGLLAMGGMSFDPSIRKSDLWNKFEPSSFTIPKFMLTINREGYFLTTNVQVNQHDHPVQIADGIKKHEEILLSNSNNPSKGARIHSRQEIAPEQWKDTVVRATEEIKQNEADKIVLAREMRLKFTDDATVSTILNKLISTQANSYVFAFERDGDCFVGASPERLVKLKNKQLLSTCLAGTAPRGVSIEEDKQIADTLLHDEKNRSEHEFVVKMIKSAMERYCKDIEIPGEPIIYPLKNLQHLYTPVTATLKSGYSIFDIIEQLHPTPALGGVPREKSLAFIREHERLDRGWYGAPIGWLDSNQHGEFAVAIRSGLIQGDEASLFAGCGVVRDSDPEAEYEETNIKFLPMLSVLGGYQ